MPIVFAQSMGALIEARRRAYHGGTQDNGVDGRPEGKLKLGCTGEGWSMQVGRFSRQKTTVGPNACGRKLTAQQEEHRCRPGRAGAGTGQSLLPGALSFLHQETKRCECSEIQLGRRRSCNAAYVRTLYNGGPCLGACRGHNQCVVGTTFLTAGLVPARLEEPEEQKASAERGPRAAQITPLVKMTALWPRRGERRNSNGS